MRLGETRLTLWKKYQKTHVCVKLAKWYGLKGHSKYIHGHVTLLKIILGDKVPTPLQLLDPQELHDLVAAYLTISPSCTRNSVLQLRCYMYLGMRKLKINNLCKIIRHFSYSLLTCKVHSKCVTLLHLSPLSLECLPLPSPTGKYQRLKSFQSQLSYSLPCFFYSTAF